VIKSSQKQQPECASLQTFGQNEREQIKIIYRDILRGSHQIGSSFDIGREQKRDNNEGCHAKSSENRRFVKNIGLFRRDTCSQAAMQNPIGMSMCRKKTIRKSTELKLSSVKKEALSGSAKEGEYIHHFGGCRSNHRSRSSQTSQ
jgi:hypothetical protein